MFLHSRSLKCFLHCLYISASLYHISYPPTLFGGYPILVTSPQECCLSWVNLWKYLWKHLLFWFAIPWNLSNISFHRTSHQIYRLKTFIRDFFAFSSQFWIPHFRKKKKHNNSHNNNKHHHKKTTNRIMQTIIILPCQIRCQMILDMIFFFYANLFLYCQLWKWWCFSTNCIFYLKFFWVIQKYPKGIQV